MESAAKRVDVTLDIIESGILSIFPQSLEGMKTYLFYLAWRAGSHPGKSNYRRSFAKQNTAAEQLGCSRETINRRNAYLRNLGILKTQPHTIGRPLLDTEMADFPDLCGIAEKFGPGGAPPMKENNSFSNSRLAKGARVTRGSHGQPSDAGITRLSDTEITRRGDAGVTPASDTGITPEPTKEPPKEPSQMNHVNSLEKPREGLHSNGSDRIHAQPQRDPDGIWEKVLQNLSLELPETTFETWVRDTNAKGTDPDTNELIIEVPHTFARDWLQSRLPNKLKELLPTGLEARFVVRNAQEQPPTHGRPRPPADNPPQTQTPDQAEKRCACSETIPPDEADKRDECRQCWEKRRIPLLSLIAQPKEANLHSRLFQYIEKYAPRVVEVDPTDWAA